MHRNTHRHTHLHSVPGSVHAVSDFSAHHFQSLISLFDRVTARHRKEWREREIDRESKEGKNDGSVQRTSLLAPGDQLSGWRDLVGLQGIQHDILWIDNQPASIFELNGLLDLLELVFVRLFLA